MRCFYPVQAYKPDDGGKLVFSERAGYSALSISCGQCVGCRLKRSLGWAVRCMHECQMHEFSSFVTLTYNDESVPHDGSLRYSDFQLFMRRVRRRFPDVRFYMAGEYGEENSRPHYHAILFGVHFGDRYPWRKSPAGFPLFRSETLDALWAHGAAEIGDASFESAGYVARYCMKKVNGKKADEHYQRVSADGEVYWLKPEFAHMSLKPGIGYTWFEKFKKDIFPRDFVVVNGNKVAVPKYYDKLLDLDSTMISVKCDVEFDRMKKALMYDVDNTPDRLLSHELVARARLSFKRKSI